MSTFLLLPFDLIQRELQDVLLLSVNLNAESGFNNLATDLHTFSSLYFTRLGEPLIQTDMYPFPLC